LKKSLKDENVYWRVVHLIFMDHLKKKRPRLNFRGVKYIAFDETGLIRGLRVSRSFRTY
jgi:hypothetical protein